MSRILVTYAVLVATMLALDVIWLGGIAMPMYKRSIGHLMAEQPNLAAGGVFYLVYAVGMLMLVVQPNASDWRAVAGYGALFGCVAYATYDLTNMATLKDWPIALTAIDVAWGTIATALAASAGRFAWSRMS